MIKRLKIVASGLAMAALVTSSGITFAGDHAKYCMDVVIEPFHLMPDGSCAVRDYWGGELQDEFYPFTKKDHLFNCEYFGPFAPLPTGDLVPSSVSTERIVGTIGGHRFESSLLCASLTNWYQESCSDPKDPMSCTFQLAQPFAKPESVQPMLFPRVTEVSIFDGAITVGKGRHAKKVPVLLATRAAGLTHIEDLQAPLVGASVTHSLLGMVTYKAGNDKHDRDYKVLDGSADLLLQGHIFAPVAVEHDPGAARIMGSICSEDLYKKLKRKKKGHGHGHHGGSHHDED